jgi:glycosyltransferase domain-containing protein
MTDLTILLTLKGRHLHTLRWLWHADRVRLPFHVFVADGEVHPSIERILSDRRSFPNLSYEYHRYEDRSFSDFFRKCADALARISTPYVKMSDNDDFLFPSGVERCMAFLGRERDYVCAGGGIPGFSLAPDGGVLHNVVGAIERLRYRCFDDGSYDCRDVDDPSAAKRVLEELRHYLSVYYYVYRTDALRIIADEIRECDFSDLDNAISVTWTSTSATGPCAL